MYNEKTGGIVIEDAEDKLAAGLSDTEKFAYDDKFILKRLMEGMTRDEIAAQLNHKNYKTIDMYMRRRGYVWNSLKQNYVLKPQANFESNLDINNVSYKVKRIIVCFDQGLDPMETAKKVGMKDHRAVADYMKSKGYYWSADRKNYILKKGIAEKNDETDCNEVKYSNEIAENTDVVQVDKNLNEYKYLLDMLENNKEKLMDILGISNNNTIPRYVLGGIAITKSLCMCYQLSELVKEFSKEKNISQREIFEVSLIEFLKKYGYENEVNALF